MATIYAKSTYVAQPFKLNYLQLTHGHLKGMNISWYWTTQRLKKPSKIIWGEKKVFLPAGNLIKKLIYKTEKKANEGA